MEKERRKDMSVIVFHGGESMHAYIVVVDRADP
jgi:hypothetical protein